jgi:WhiB family redox-sensing transcriptional regulator
MSTSIMVDALLTLTGDPADILTAEVGPSPLLAAIVAALPAWHADAACAEFDVELWFPTKGASNRPALAVCGRCPVRVECLHEALDDETLDHGIRGGMTANARKVARRSRPVESEAS